MAGRSETTLRDVYRALFRHKKKAFAFFVTVMAVSLAAVIFLPRTYRSEGKLFLRLGRANTTLDPTAGAGAEPVVVVPQSREEEINSVVNILGSRAMLEEVVDTLGPEAILPHESDDGPEDGPEAAAEEPPLLERLNLRTPISDRERAILKLTKNVSVAPVKKSNVIQISYDGESPEGCQRVVNCLIDAYLKEHLRLNQTTGVHEFFVQQKERSSEALAEAQRKLRDLKDQTGLASPAEQRALLVARVSRLEDELFQTSEELAVAEKRVDWLRKKLAETPDTLITETSEGIADYGTDMMRQQLYQLRMSEEEMEAKYTENHPRMQAMEAQREAAAKILAREKPTRSETKTGRNRIAEELQLELDRQEPLVVSLTAQARMQQAELASAQADLKRLNENEVQIADLQREVELHEANYRKYSADLEQARIDDALQSDRISNVSIAQPATLERLPVRPNRKLLLALALVIGLGGAVALAVGREFIDHSLRDPEEIERKLEIPTLVSIPRLHRRQMVLNGKGARNGH